MRRLLAAFSIALFLGSAAAWAAHLRDGGIIRNSGSTNFSGYTIKVWSDGSTWAAHSDRAGNQIDSGASGRVPAALAQTFLNEAKQARHNRVTAQACAKSASFGTSTTVEYHGWTSPDLDCPGGGFAVALAADAHKIAALLRIQGVHPRPVHLPIAEPRRFPSDTPSGQPSPTPEHAARVS